MAVATQLKSLAHSISFRSGISTAMARRQFCSRIVMYHGITPPNAAAFAEQLRYLVQNFRIVTLERLVQRFKRRSGPAGDEIALTFDDGLRNNWSVVYPLLKDLRAPATFFVCPGLIESGKWLWNHEVRCRLQSLPPESVMELARYLSIPGQSIECIIAWMKGLDLDDRRRAEGVIRIATRRFAPSPEQRQAYDMMTWQELARLDPALITVGSHSFSHPILTTLDDGQLGAELRESRRKLEENLGRPVEYFCYPNGSLDSRVYRAVKREYSAAVTTESGLLDREAQPDPYRLPRIPSAEQAALMAWRLHRPGA
ncbi:MAG TPA: polysaccharide deacetylase family protein [Candidatus Limnocylindrales bacterium]|nr:polysaccharide deacetylase family protein [Candidatus Limnocylindrales bacterium]